MGRIGTASGSKVSTKTDLEASNRLGSAPPHRHELRRRHPQRRGELHQVVQSGIDVPGLYRLEFTHRQTRPTRHSSQAEPPAQPQTTQSRPECFQEEASLEFILR